MTSQILCVAGSPSIDKLFEVDRLSPGDIHRPMAFVEVPGGKGLNVARAAACLGASVLATGLLAGPAGRWISDALGECGVDGRFVWVDGQTRSSLSVADRETGRLTEFYEAAVTGSPEAWEKVESIVASLFPQVSWCALSGSIPTGAPEDGYARIIGACGSGGVRTAVDVRAEALAAAVEARPDLVKINHLEAGELLARSVEGVDAAAAAASEIRNRLGGEGHAAAVTLGREGAVLVDPSGAAFHGRIVVDGRYPVGSGDSFLGGLLSALQRGGGWRDALAIALGAGAANAEMPGAGRFDVRRAAELAAASEPAIRELG